VGTLLASGLIAGEALMAIVLAALVNVSITLPQFGGSGAAGLIVFLAVGFILVAVPLRAPKAQPSSGGAPGATP